jgi:hypothetical protein
MNPSGVHANESKFAMPESVFQIHPDVDSARQTTYIPLGDILDIERPYSNAGRQRGRRHGL